KGSLPPPAKRCPFDAGFLGGPRSFRRVNVPMRAAPVFPYDFDPTARTKARAYERGSRRVSVLGGTAMPLAFAVLFWASGGSRALADWTAARAAGSQLWADTLYITAFAALFAGLTLPVAFYSGHVREKR